MYLLSNNIKYSYASIDLMSSSYSIVFLLSLYKVVFSVSLFVCILSITHLPLDRFASNFDLGTRKNDKNVYMKIAKIGIYDQALINLGSNAEVDHIYSKYSYSSLRHYWFNFVSS